MQVDLASGDVEEWAEEEGVTEDELGNMGGAYPAMVANNTAPMQLPASAAPEPVKKTSQYQYTSKSDNPSALQRCFERDLDSLVNITRRELLALSPDFRKHTVDFCKVNRTAAYSLSLSTTASFYCNDDKPVKHIHACLLFPNYGAQGEDCGAI